MKILIIGETCYDKFIYGECYRICPEAPVPVFTPKHEKVNEGMASNVYKNLEAFEKIHKRNFTFKLLTNTSYNEKIRYIDEASNQMLLRVDKEKDYSFEEKLCFNQIKEYDAVVVSDYDKGLLSESDLENIGKTAKKSFIDTKKKYNHTLAEHFDFIKINKKEAIENGFYNVPEIFNKLILTAASDGCYFKEEHFAINNRSEVIDVCGAGDTFLSAFSYEMLFSKNIKKAIDFAQDSCQYVIGKRGVVTV